MAGFYGWIRNIICYMCFLNVFLHILPGNSFKKYVHFFGSLLLIVIVLEPLGNMADLSQRFEKVWRLESLREELGDLEITRNSMEELRSQKVNEAFQGEMKRQVEEIVKAYGLYPVDTELVFSQTEEGVFQIEEVQILAGKEKGGIHIQVGDEEQISEEIEKQVKDIKNEIHEVYHISLANINISIQE